MKDTEDNACVRLSDLKVAGYNGEISSGIYIAPLEKDGSNKMFEYDGDFYETLYYWKDSTAYPAGWYGPDDEPMKDGSSVLPDADKIFFQPGEAMCFVIDTGFIGCTVDFPSLGLTTAE